jgi:hypothetical protein
MPQFMAAVIVIGVIFCAQRFCQPLLWSRLSYPLQRKKNNNVHKQRFFIRLRFAPPIFQGVVAPAYTVL